MVSFKPIDRDMLIPFKDRLDELIEFDLSKEPN
jgi:hypothetical protein